MNFDDELLKAATGDLEDAPMPHEPNQLPQPPQKSNKAPWIIVVIAIAIVIAIIIICASIHGNNKSDENSENNQYPNYYESTHSEEIQETITINPFDVIEKVIIDTTDDNVYVKMNPNYKVTNSNFSIEYVGTDNGYKEADYDNYLSVKNATGSEIAKLYFRCNLDTYISTEKVLVGVYDDFGDSHYIEDEYSTLGLQFSPTEYKIDAIECHYVSSSNDISADILDEMKKKATETMKEQYPLATLQKTYFGYDDYGKGNYIYNGIEGWHGGYTNEVKIAFSYTEDGHNYVACVNFYNLKIADDGEICNYNEITPEIGGEVESFSALEEDQNENWGEFYEF